MLGASPNITGEYGGVTIRQTNLYQTGAFGIKKPSNQNGWAGSPGSEVRDITFSAASSNSKYTGHDLQPRSIRSFAVVKS